MQYILLLNETDAEFAQRDDPLRAGEYWSAWIEFIGVMAPAGIIVKGDGLHGPAAATTIRVRDGKRQVQDGPFADTKEKVGGYFVIDVQTLEAALEWASRAPSAAYASVELRPLLPPMAS